MRLKQIRLQNFRCFEDFTLELHPEATLLAGRNGAGKTTLFDALRLALGWSLSGMPEASSLPVKDADVRLVRHIVGDIVDLQPAGSLRIEWALDTAAGESSWAFGANGLAADRALVQRNKSLGRSILTGEAGALPLIAAYEASRGWTAIQRLNQSPPTNRLGGYSNWSSPSASLGTMTGWIKKYTFVELQEKAPVPQLAGVNRAVCDAIPGTSALTFNVRHDEVRVHFEDGAIESLERLSDGYRSMVAMVADIAWRASVLNPHLQERAARETEGVVLIDELELHLHPSWQWEVLPALRRAFPRIQLIATTHSPQVLSSAQPDQVRLLSRDHATALTPTHLHGWDSVTVLEDLMGTTGRPREVADRLAALSTAIDARDVEQARALLAHLERDLGSDAPELLRARWALQMDLGDDSGAPPSEDDTGSDEQGRG